MCVHTRMLGWCTHAAGQNATGTQLRGICRCRSNQTQHAPAGLPTTPQRSDTLWLHPHHCQKPIAHPSRSLTKLCTDPTAGRRAAPLGMALLHRADVGRGCPASRTRGGSKKLLNGMPRASTRHSAAGGSAADGPSTSGHDHDQRLAPDGVPLGRLASAAIAVAVVHQLAFGACAARAADRPWKPRRHHRAMGERYGDAWAEELVEVRERRALGQSPQPVRLCAAPPDGSMEVLGGWRAWQAV